MHSRLQTLSELRSSSMQHHSDLKAFQLPPACNPVAIAGPELAQSLHAHDLVHLASSLRFRELYAFVDASRFVESGIDALAMSEVCAMAHMLASW